MRRVDEAEEGVGLNLIKRKSELKLDWIDEIGNGEIGLNLNRMKLGRGGQPKVRIKVRF